MAAIIALAILWRWQIYFSSLKWEMLWIDSELISQVFWPDDLKWPVSNFILEYPKCDDLYKKLQNHEIFVQTHPKNQPGAGVDPVSGK